MDINQVVKEAAKYDTLAEASIASRNRMLSAQTSVSYEEMTEEQRNERIQETYANLDTFTTEDLCKYLKNRSINVSNKLAKLSVSYLNVDQDDEDEVKEVVDALRDDLADGISVLNSRLNRDVDLMMKLVYMAHAFSSAQEPMVPSEVLDKICLQLAIKLDGRQYDFWRWHACDSSREQYSESLVDVIKRAAIFLRPFLDELTEKIHGCVDEFPQLSDLKQLSEYMGQYEHLEPGWEKGEEVHRPRWKRARTLIERIMRTAHAPEEHKAEIIRQTVWLIKMFEFEWLDNEFQMLLLIFAVTAIEIYANLDAQDITKVHADMLEQQLYIVHIGYEFIDREMGLKEHERHFTEEEILKLMKELDRSIGYLCDYLVACKAKDEQTEMPRRVRELVFFALARFMRYGHVAPFEEKYPFLAAWLFQTGIELMNNRGELNDFNAQDIISCVEFVIINTDRFTKLTTDLGAMIADYYQFSYAENLKGCFMDKEYTFRNHEYLLKESGWCTKASVERMLENVKNLNIRELTQFMPRWNVFLSELKS